MEQIRGGRPLANFTDDSLRFCTVHYPAAQAVENVTDRKQKDEEQRNQTVVIHQAAECN